MMPSWKQRPGSPSAMRDKKNAASKKKKKKAPNKDLTVKTTNQFRKGFMTQAAPTPTTAGAPIKRRSTIMMKEPIGIGRSPTGVSGGSKAKLNKKSDSFGPQSPLS